MIRPAGLTDRLTAQHRPAIALGLPIMTLYVMGMINFRGYAVEHMSRVMDGRSKVCDLFTRIKSILPRPTRMITSAVSLVFFNVVLRGHG